MNPKLCAPQQEHRSHFTSVKWAQWAAALPPELSCANTNDCPCVFFLFSPSPHPRRFMHGMYALIDLLCSCLLCHSDFGAPVA